MCKTKEEALESAALVALKNLVSIGSFVSKNMRYLLVFSYIILSVYIELGLLVLCMHNHLLYLCTSVSYHMFYCCYFLCVCLLFIPFYSVSLVIQLFHYPFFVNHALCM